VFHHLDWYPDWRVSEAAVSASWRLSASMECGTNPAALVALQDSTGVVAHRFAVGIGPDPLATAQAIADSIVTRLWPRDLDEFRNLGGPAHHPGGATRHFFQGEEAFSRDDWHSAENNFAEALKIDPSFQLARWRLMLVKQWRRVSFEEDLELLLQDPGDLPPLLLDLLQVGAIPDVQERIVRYARIAASHPRDSYAALSYANEVFVRGPLVGIPLDSGLALMREVEARNPTRNLAPALDHQAWGAIRLGRRELARRAVDHRVRLPNTGGLGEFFRLAYWERFHPAVAPVLRWWAFRETSEEDLRLIVRVHRLALTFDLPDAQAALAELVLARADARPVRAGAFEGLGLARMAAGRVTEAFTAFDSAAVLLSGAGASRVPVWCVATGALGYPVVPERDIRWCESSLRSTPRDDPRAWENWAMAAMAAGTRGDVQDLDYWLARYDSLPDAEGTRRWRALLQAERHALDGRWEAALALSDAAIAYDSAGAIGGAFLRSAAHLRRAAWWEAAGNPGRAESELVWAENTDLRGWPVGRAQAGEVDAVFGTLARVRRAHLALSRGDRSACPMVKRVERLWKKSDHPARLKAMIVPLLRQCQ
jgi:tetratricopeptide (TPR) repeat protein